MPQIRRGLRIEDDDQVPKYQKQSLDANRKRTNFEKDMDDLLFGGGMKPIPRRQPKQQPVKAKQQPSKQPVKPTPPTNQPNNQPNKSIDNSSNQANQKPKVDIKVQPKIAPIPEVKPKIEVKPNRPEEKKPQPPPASSKDIGSIRSIGINSKIENRNIPDSKPEPIPQEKSIQQPKQHEQPKIGTQKKIQISGTVYNRPVYIRKLKKIAEQFNFATENANNHSVTDVVRPFECDKNRVKKLSDYDFSDQQFPATSYSLGHSAKNTASEWKKHNQMVKSSVFGKYIDPNDINPGKLSSPQFLSTLSSLAEMQTNIKRLVEDQKVDSNGFYYVRLNINGVWRYIAVDNKLPFASGQALGAQSFNDNQSELWAALIEKAYAKAYSGYDVFSRNIPRQNFLRDLTGAPVRKYLISDSDLPNIIRNAISAGQPVLAVPKQQVLSLGLNPNHSFAVINCKSNGGLQLRNNWGTLEERTKLSISKQGVFELSSNQAKDFISYVMIAQTNNSFSSSTIQSKHKTGFYSTFTFRVKNNTHGFFTVSQWDQRLFPQNAYEYSSLRVIVQKKNSDGTATYVNAGFSSSRNLDVEVNLIAGQYQVFVTGHWKSREYDYDLTFFGQQKVELKRQYTSKFPNKITESLTKLNLETGKRSALGHCNQFIQHHKQSNLVLVTADNTSEKDYLFNQDFSKVNWNSLLLLNAKNNEQTYQNLTGSQIDEYKNYANENRKWAVSIEPRSQFTWVISCSQDFDGQNFKKWGFR